MTMQPRRPPSAQRRPNPVFSDEYRAIREAVVAGRKRLGMSQARLAAALGKAASHVAMIERGQRRVDALELYAIAELLAPDPMAFLADIADRLTAVRGGAMVAPAPAVVLHEMVDDFHHGEPPGGAGEAAADRSGDQLAPGSTMGGSR